jgi:hypothetical protein
VKCALEGTDRWARRTFAYSIVYLALLFGAMSFDSVKTIPLPHAEPLEVEGPVEVAASKGGDVAVTPER